MKPDRDAAPMALSPLHTPLKGSRANAQASSGGVDSRILTALFLGVAAGALASTVTEWARPAPSPAIGNFGTQAAGCPECPKCDGPEPIEASSGHPPGKLSKYAQLRDSEHASDGASSSRALSVGGVINDRLLPGEWWTPKTAPAATGAEKGDETLKAILEEIAPDGEVLTAVSNKALINENGDYGMLRTWLDGVQRSKVKNYLVICLDETVAGTMKKLGVPYWHRERKALADGDETNHGISAQKFHILREFLVLGYSVLLSDVDIVTLDNPFDHLYRDSDVEGLSDGYDERTAYGWNDGIDDPKMGWARYAQTMRVFAMNSGLFYLKPSDRTLRFMDGITARLERAKEWDQAVYNEEMFFPSHGDHVNPGVTTRVMEIDVFMNSKTLFVVARHDKKRMRNLKPAMVHVNYHPDKWERMKAIWAYFVDGKKKALDAFPDGSCKNAPDCR